MKLAPLGLLIALLLVAPAHASTLAVRDATELDPVLPGGSTSATVAMVFNCDNPSEVHTGEWTVQAELILPEGATGDVAPVAPIPGDACASNTETPFEVDVTVQAGAGMKPQTQYPIELRVQVTPAGDGVTAQASNEATTGLTLTVEGTPQNTTAEPAASDPDDAGEDAPGPALPLLLGMLGLAVALRRRS